MAHDEQGHTGPYFMVFIALCVCTALSALADVIQIDNKLVLIVIVMAIATAKALFVLTYFMHLKFEGNWKLVLLAPTAVLAIGLPLALLPDIGVSYYDNLAPQSEYTEHTPGVVAHESGEADH
ncbi:MAG: cytochrome C oxidase subunit IV family protein [Planctomycetaceae bacterium]